MDELILSPMREKRTRVAHDMMLYETEIKYYEQKLKEYQEKKDKLKEQLEVIDKFLNTHGDTNE